MHWDAPLKFGEIDNLLFALDDKSAYQNFDVVTQSSNKFNFLFSYNYTDNWTCSGVTVCNYAINLGK